jgi:hypothetical protein
MKVDWAKHHLSLLEKEVHRFLDRPPYTIMAEDDLEAGEYRVSLDVDPVSSAIVLMLGDFVHCLRGSLDHLACHLTLTQGGTPNPKASFPVMAVDNADTRRDFAKQVIGIPPAAIGEIKSFQPYHAGDRAQITKLWQLHRLWNIDKHRRIPAHSTRANLGFTHPPHVIPISRGDDNSGIVRFPLSAKPDIQVDPTLEITILFGDEEEGIMVAPVELCGICELIDKEVFPRFERFF